MSTTSVKLKFRESTVEGKEGRLFFQVIRNRCIRQITLPYMIYSDEWSGEGLGHDSEETTQIYLASIENSVVDKANSRIIGLLD